MGGPLNNLRICLNIEKPENHVSGVTVLDHGSRDVIASPLLSSDLLRPPR
jgi:hypothetical protein